jgi:hypothetical protein
MFTRGTRFWPTAIYFTIWKRDLHRHHRHPLSRKTAGCRSHTAATSSGTRMFLEKSLFSRAPSRCHWSIELGPLVTLVTLVTLVSLVSLVISYVFSWMFWGSPVRTPGLFVWLLMLLISFAQKLLADSGWFSGRNTGRCWEMISSTSTSRRAVGSRGSPRCGCWMWYVGYVGTIWKGLVVAHACFSIRKHRLQQRAPQNYTWDDDGLRWCWFCASHLSMFLSPGRDSSWQ